MSDDGMTDDGLMDQSEMLDPDELGEEVGDDYVPALADYPPDEARGAEDPNLYAEDDLDTRSFREATEAELSPRDEEIVDLLRPSDEDGLDTEAEELGEIGELEQGEPIAPEVAAVHVVDEPGA